MSHSLYVPHSCIVLFRACNNKHTLGEGEGAGAGVGDNAVCLRAVVPELGRSLDSES
jgi:hypothetical protein